VEVFKDVNLVFLGDGLQPVPGPGKANCKRLVLQLRDGAVRVSKGFQVFDGAVS
jgi:hypothetical protein